MNSLILNRKSQLPEDGWHQIEVPGDHVNHEAKVIQVIDAKAVASIVNRFAQEAAAPNFSGVLVDRDHFSLDADHSTEALGWAMEVRDNGGVPEARVSWTAQGRPLVESKPDQPPAFKFFSTVYDTAECEKLGTRKVGDKTYQIVRPLRLDRLALTNDPNNKGAKPISNRQTAATAERSESKPTMKAVLKVLGLADDASEESAVAALQKIQNRASLAETLTTERDGLLAAQVEADLEKYKSVIKNRDAFKKQLLANRAATIELLEGLQTAEVDTTTQRITNRAGAATPAERDAEGKKKEEKAAEGALAQKIANRAHEIVKQKSTGRRPYSFNAAFSEARTEIEGAAK